MIFCGAHKPVHIPLLCHFPHSPHGYFQRIACTFCLHCVDLYSSAFPAQILSSSDSLVKRVSLRPPSVLHCQTCIVPSPALTHQASSPGVKGSPFLVSVSSLLTCPSHVSVGTVTSPPRLYFQLGHQSLYSFWAFPKVPSLYQGLSLGPYLESGICPTSLKLMLLSGLWRSPFLWCAPSSWAGFSLRISL